MLSLKFDYGLIDEHLNSVDFGWIIFSKSTKFVAFQALHSNRISWYQGRMINENHDRGAYIKFLAIFQRSAHLYFCTYELNTKNVYTQRAKNSKALGIFKRF